MIELSSTFPLTITEVSRDRFSREAQFRLKTATINTPHFATLIRSKDELELFIRMRNAHLMDRVGTFVIRLFDTPSILLPKLLSNQQTTIGGGYVDQGFKEAMDKSLVLIDPVTEYLYYEFYLSKFKSSRLLPEVLREYAHVCETKKKSLSANEYSKWKDAYHRLFWNSMYEDARSRGRLVGETLDLELRSGGKIAVAPVPIIDSTTTLSISIKMNDMTRELSRDRTAESATYLILHKSALANESLMDEVKSFLAKVDSRLVVMKFKQLDLTDSTRISEREAYRNLLQELALLRERDRSRGFMLLEAENQAFPSAAVAFDIVSTSFTGQDKDSSFGHKPYGAWYDPKEMTQRDYDQVKRIFRNNGRLPHGCPPCRSITDLESVGPEEWYAKRREHYCFAMQEYMEMIARAVHEKNIELAREKLVNSSISVLKSLIPRS